MKKFLSLRNHLICSRPYNDTGQEAGYNNMIAAAT